MYKLLPALALVALTATATSQALQTDYLVAGPPNAKTDVGGGIFAVDAAKGTSTLLQNLPADLRRASCVISDPRNALGWFAGTSGPVKGLPGPVHIYYFTAVAGRVVNTRKLNTENLTTDTIIRTLVLAGDDLVFGSDLRVGTIPVAGGKTTTLFAYRRTSNNFGAMASDGRYLYTNIYDNSGYSAGGGTIWRHDLQDLTKRVSLFQVDQFPTNIRGLAVDADGKLLVVDKGNFASPKLRQFDLRTNAKLQDIALPWMSLSGGMMSVAADPIADTVVVTGQGVTGFSDSKHYALTLTKWSAGTAFGGVDHDLSSVASRRTPGLVRRGFECDSKSSPALMSLASSRPNVGNTSYSVDLSGPANTVAVLLIGAGGAFNPVVLAPTKCELGVNPILALGAVIPNSGRLAVPLPIPSNAQGFFIDSQWAVFEPSTNALGLVTKQVGGIYVR